MARKVTAAEANPGSPPDEPVVVVAFEAVLDEYWPAWTDAAPADLFDGVQMHGVTHYGFPASRLGYRAPPTALEAVLARVASAVDSAEWHQEYQVLVVEKRGGTYAIAPMELSRALLGSKLLVALAWLI